MEKKTFNQKAIVILIIAVCAAAVIGFVAGRSNGRGQMLAQQIDNLQELQEQNEKLLSDQQKLQNLNRSSVEKLILEDGPIYVIGHRSPDSDTVCSAIAYAKLLCALGYQAEPAITQSVNHETEYILNLAGVETPEELPDASGLNIFLVDHSEYAQAAEGMKDAHIVGILDHHGVGTVTTGHQVLYQAKPIGATATIVWLDYLNYGVEIDKTTATLLLGAILSDTGGFGGSTTTEADRQAAADLAEIAGIPDTDALYQTLHAEALSYEGMSGEEILFSDYKEYEASGVTFGIALVSAIDEDTAKSLAAQMKEALLSDSIGTVVGACRMDIRKRMWT